VISFFRGEKMTNDVVRYNKELDSVPL